MQPLGTRSLPNSVNADYFLKSSSHAGFYHGPIYSNRVEAPKTGVLSTKLLSVTGYNTVVLKPCMQICRYQTYQLNLTPHSGTSCWHIWWLSFFPRQIDHVDLTFLSQFLSDMPAWVAPLSHLPWASNWWELIFLFFFNFRFIVGQNQALIEPGWMRVLGIEYIYTYKTGKWCQHVFLGWVDIGSMEGVVAAFQCGFVTLLPVWLKCGLCSWWYSFFPHQIDPVDLYTIGQFCLMHWPQ